MLLTAIAVVVLSNLLTGITVDNYGTAVIVAIVLGLLRIFVRPVLILLSLPITILTLGLFLFVINAIIIHLAGFFVDGFYVNGIFTAIIFSLLLSFFQSVLYSFLKEENKR
jgi:putative membrane protein